MRPPTCPSSAAIKHRSRTDGRPPLSLMPYFTLASCGASTVGKANGTYLLLVPNLLPMHSAAHSTNPSQSADSFEMIERVAYRQAGAAFSPHRHDTYTVALTIAGVQAFNYRGTMRHSLPGQVLILHPDELHDGHCHDEAGFSYRAAYSCPNSAWRRGTAICVWWRIDGLRLDRGSLQHDHRLRRRSRPRCP